MPHAPSDRYAFDGQSATSSHAPDPSVDFIHEFADPKQWSIKRRVPIFIEHEEEDPDTGEKEYFGADELQEIADNCNRLAASGNPPGLTLGHTLEKAPESEQPPTVGFGKNYVVARGPQDGKVRIYHDEWYKPDQFAEAETYPYRSVERWKAGKYFKPVALLRREPALNLGVASYQRDGDRVIRYSASAKEPYMPGPAMAPPDDVVTPSKPEMGAPDLDIEPSPKDHQVFAKLCMAHPTISKMMKRYESEEEPPDDNLNPMTDVSEPMRGAAGAAMPSATNMAVPEPMKKPYQANDLAVRYAKLERESKARDERLQALEADAAAARREAKVARYSADLSTLQAEGHLFDHAAELADCVDMNDAQFTKHKVRIVTHYGKAAFGRGVQTAPTSPMAISAKSDAEKGEKVNDLIRRYGGSYEDAVARYDKGER